MNSVVNWPKQDRDELFQLTASERGIPIIVIEKDFWVCWTLGKIFADDEFSKKIIFKGGTSLSKVFGIIERFSEDIDLVIDWSDFVPEPVDKSRSRTRQNEFNKKTNEAAQAYLRSTFVPRLTRLLHPYCEVTLNTSEPGVVNVKYQDTFKDSYIRPEIKLEIGPLSAKEPHSTFPISPYAAETFPDQFQEPQVQVLCISAERTFWEKATILHAEAHWPKNKGLRPRYSRHYYDMMCLAKSKYKDSAIADTDLMRRVVEFKDQFYHQAWASYATAIPGSFRLFPPDHVLRSHSVDFEKMKEMIFGMTPEFKEVLIVIQELENEINSLGS